MQQLKYTQNKIEREKQTLKLSLNINCPYKNWDICLFLQRTVLYASGAFNISMNNMFKTLIGTN